MDSLTDNALMLQVKEGQLDKLGLLYERYNKNLYGFFYRLTLDQAHSEDLVQNVFLRILKYKHSYHGDGKFSTWMYHMARNLFADHYKKHKKMGFKESLEMTDKYFSIDQNAETERIRTEEIDLLQQAMNRLSVEKREILMLSKIQEMRYKDIADVLEINENAVKVRIFRALKDLKAAYLILESGSKSK